MRNPSSDVVVRELRAIALHIVRLLTTLYQEQGRLETPKRWAQAWGEMTRGTAIHPSTSLGEANQGLFLETLRGLLGMSPLLVSGFSSIDFSPLIGAARIYYLPENILIGLSKFARIKRDLESQPFLADDFVRRFVEAVEDPRLRSAGVAVEAVLRDLGREILNGDPADDKLIYARHGVGNLADVKSLHSEYARALLNGQEEERFRIARWALPDDLLFPKSAEDELSEHLLRALNVMLGEYSLVADHEQAARGWARSLLAQTVGERLDFIPKVIGGTIEMVDGYTVIGRMPFHSVCEHHMLPVTGEATVVLAGESVEFDPCDVAGIAFRAARRLTIQERLSSDIVAELCNNAGGVFALTGARHLCKEYRGVRDPCGRVLHETRSGTLDGDDGMRKLIQLIPQLREADLFPLPFSRPTFH